MCAVDAYEWQAVEETISSGELIGSARWDEDGNVKKGDEVGADPKDKERYGTPFVERKPHFHEWATATPGMICVARRARNASFRNYVAAETASPVIVCAACQPKIMEDQFFFAGVCRSKSVRPIDDGVGPSTDEYFTMAIGGMVTLLNNSSEAVWAGDWIAWTFCSEVTQAAQSKRAKKNPRRIGIELAGGFSFIEPDTLDDATSILNVCLFADPLSDRTVGRCLTFAKPGGAHLAMSLTCEFCVFTCNTDTRAFLSQKRSTSCFAKLKVVNPQDERQAHNNEKKEHPCVFAPWAMR